VLLPPMHIPKHFVQLHTGFGNHWPSVSVLAQQAYSVELIEAVFLSLSGTIGMREIGHWPQTQTGETSQPRPVLHPRLCMISVCGSFFPVDGFVWTVASKEPAHLLKLESLAICEV
jgi:hypothetical protein